jgi:hypothetical protein
VIVLDTMENHGAPCQTVVACELPELHRFYLELQVSRLVCRDILNSDSTLHIYYQSKECNKAAISETVPILQAATLCSLICSHQSFGGRYRLHLQGWS